MARPGGRSSAVATVCDSLAVRTPPREGLATVREAAAQLGVHPQTVRRLIQEGRLESVRIERGLYVPRGALDELVARQHRSPRR